MEEDRELSIMLFLDLSPTMHFGFSKTKKDILLELFFLIGFSAIKDGDGLGTCIYGGKKVEYIPRSKNRSSIFQIYSQIIGYKNVEPDAKLENVLQLIHTLKLRRNLIFIFTDTLEIDQKKFQALCFQNEVVFIHIFHSFENTLEIDDP
jgi:uncharacterized protein (DUF58 family)